MLVKLSNGHSGKLAPCFVLVTVCMQYILVLFICKCEESEENKIQ